MNKDFLWKKLKICFVLIFFSFAIINCNQAVDNRKIIQNNSSINEQVNSILPVINKEVAITEAKKMISTEYDLNHYNEVIAESETNWIIGFEFRPEYKDRTGGQPTVAVDKKTGKISSYYFPK